MTWARKNVPYPKVIPSLPPINLPSLASPSLSINIWVKSHTIRPDASAEKRMESRCAQPEPLSSVALLVSCKEPRIKVCYLSAYIALNHVPLADSSYQDISRPS